MKSSTFYIIVATLITNTTMAQNKNAGITDIPNKQEMAFQKDYRAVDPGIPIDEHDVNRKALKDFTKLGNNIKELKWYSEKDFTVAVFKTNNRSNRRYYDAKGNFICNILSCEEQFLPASVIDIVKSTYYLDYHIISAQEIQTEKKKFYFVFIENKNTWKKLMVYDTEMEVVQECFN